MLQTQSLSADVVVVGGGVSGVCAAIAAARHGAASSLVHDRPVLGGNSSSEIRVHVCGADSSGGRPHARESGIIEELRLEEVARNPQRAATMWDLILWEKVSAESNITLLLNTPCTGARMASPSSIGAVLAARESTEDHFELHGLHRLLDQPNSGPRPVRTTATGARPREHDEARRGRQQDHGLQPDVAGSGHGIHRAPAELRAGLRTCEQLRTEATELVHGHWWVEYGGELDIIRMASRSATASGLHDGCLGPREEPLRQGRCHELGLVWFGFVPGKQSRRLLGDYIL